jgi:hypothetical protein
VRESGRNGPDSRFHDYEPFSKRNPRSASRPNLHRREDELERESAHAAKLKQLFALARELASACPR